MTIEGLRAPSIGPSLAGASNAGRAARALAAAGAAAAAIGAANPADKLPAVSGQMQQALPQVSRTAPLSSAAGPSLMGNVGQKAPSLTRAMPGVGSALEGTAARAAAPSLARAVGGPLLEGAAKAIAPAARVLAPAAGVLNSKAVAGPLGVLLDLAGDLRNPKPTLGAKEEADALKIADHNKRQRKGNKFPGDKNQPTKTEPLEDGVRYILHFSVTAKVGEQTLPATEHQVPFFKGDNIAISHDATTVYVGGQPNVNTRGTPYVIVDASAGSITREDGAPMPPAELEPIDPGAPFSNLNLPATNQEAPVLPSTGSQNPGPTRQQSLPGTGAPTPNQGTRTPNNPSQPNRPEPTKPGGETTPQQPQTPLTPTNPSGPMQGTQTPLPNIPAAPSTGSATATQPIFPSAFNTYPNNRNDDALKPRKPEEPEPQRKPGCSDPCMASLQNAIPPINDSLDGLQDALDQLLNGQQQQQEDKDKFVTINVSVCNCNGDGTASFDSVPIQVLESQVLIAQNQFEALAKIQEFQCKIQRHSERSHNILGGDIWFANNASREANYKVKIEQKIKQSGSLFGFPSVADNSQSTTGSTGDNNAQPIAGQMEAKSIIDLINAYTSNLYHRAGYHGLPASVPKTLLGYTDGDTPETIQDFATYFVWFVKQVDALIGKFPINITIEDVDPLTQGNQTKNVELPNIAEALAEMYGLNISSSVNGDVAVNFLMRLASEVIATKNSSLITQDYVRANAAFLGYKGNPARREINYSFDAAKLGSLDEFLNEAKGYIVGWEEDDKESVVGFLQRIVFSAGIIKAAFFRDQKRLTQLQKEIESMIKGDKAASDAEWNALLALINDPDNYFNKDAAPHPRVRDKPVEPPPGSNP
jgi:hypothetical protein